MKFVAFMSRYRTELMAIVVMILFYWITRLINLTDLPIFTDEAIYIRWAQIGSRDASWRFISLTDGKQPLFVWAAMITVRLFSDPLFAGRIVSVLAGFFSMIGVGLLGYELFRNRMIGFLSSLLYITSPFALMYDRLALMDSLLATFSVWSLYLAVRLIRMPRLATALILGMSLGGGVLTKTSGFLSIYLLPCTILASEKIRKLWFAPIIRIIGAMIVAVLFSQLYYSVLRLSPWFHMIAQKDTTFVELPQTYSVSSLVEWFGYRTRFFIGNIRALHEWMRDYMTIPVYLLSLFSILFIKSQWNKKLLLLFWSVPPMIALAFAGKVLYPRFIFFMYLPLLVLASWSIYYVKERYKLKKAVLALFVAFILLYPLYVQSKILFSVLTAPIPRADYGQYVNDVYSGWGIREVNDMLGQLAQSEEITVFTDGTFGLLPYGVEIYHVENPNIRIIGMYPTPDEYTDEITAEIQSRPTYYIANQIAQIPLEWNAALIASWQKGLREDRTLRLYRLYEKGVKLPEDEQIFN